MPWSAIFSAPLLASSTMYAPGMPPVARTSARFWKSTRYVRGPLAPSIGGSSRADRSAGPSNWTARVKPFCTWSTGPWSCGMRPSVLIAATCCCALRIAAAAVDIFGIARSIAARSILPSFGDSSADSMPEATSMRDGSPSIARRSSANVRVRTAARSSPATGAWVPRLQEAPLVASRALRISCWNRMSVAFAPAASPLWTCRCIWDTKPAAAWRWFFACKPLKPIQATMPRSRTTTSAAAVMVYRLRGRRRRRFLASVDRRVCWNSIFGSTSGTESVNGVASAETTCVVSRFSATPPDSCGAVLGASDSCDGSGRPSIYTIGPSLVGVREFERHADVIWASH